MLLGVPFFVFPQFARAIGNYLRLCITKGANSAFRQLMNVAFFWGMIGGYYKKQVPKNSANNP
jgi:hypothetical protein